MTPQRTRSLRSWARPAGMAVLGIVLAVAGVVLEETHFQNVVTWITGVSTPFRLSWFVPPCWGWVEGFVACRYALQTDDLLAPILTVSGVTLMTAIAMKRRYRRMKYGEIEAR